jgi:hypothetical protein
MAEHTRGPAGPPTDGAAGAGASTRGPSHGAERSPGRGRLWAVLAAVVVVIGVVLVVLFVVNRPEAPAAAPEPPPVAETVTLPPPTPTIEPVALPEGASPFLQALPREVLAFALTEVAEEPGLVAEGALEAHRLVYDDGARQIVATAGQWRDTDAVAARFDQVLAAESEAAGVPVEEAGASADDAAAEEPPAGTADEAASDEAASDEAPAGPRLEQGFVEVDGQQVGRFLQLTREDGTGSLWWTNGTALLRLDGPGDALRDVYAAFPL